MLKLFLSKALPSGQLVLPLYSLPLLLDSIEHSGGSSEPCVGGLSVSLARELGEVAQTLSSHSIRATSLPITTGSSSGSSYISGCEVFVLECPGSLGIGGKVWDATFSLLDYLAHHPDIIRDKVAIELGSGTGLAGGTRTRGSFFCLYLTLTIYIECMVLILLGYRSLFGSPTSPFRRPLRHARGAPPARSQYPSE
jgi:hypothetical protein